MKTFILLLLSVILAPVVLVADSEQAQRVRRATEVINETMDVPDKTIPEYLFRDAYGIAVIPDVLKAGFIVGGRRGKGIMTIRSPGGQWGELFFITLAGGSIGWQVGVQRVDIVLVFKTEKSVESVLEGRFTLGGDAAIAVGPVGRQAQATTDLELEAEIFSYARARGFFAGLSLEGSVIQVESKDNAVFYGDENVSVDDVADGRLKRIPTEAIVFRQTITEHFDSNN